MAASQKLFASAATGRPGSGLARGAGRRGGRTSRQLAARLSRKHARRLRGAAGQGGARCGCRDPRAAESAALFRSGTRAAACCRANPATQDLIEAARQGGDLAALLAELLGVDGKMAAQILDDESGAALAVACKGASLDRASFFRTGAAGAAGPRPRPRLCGAGCLRQCARQRSHPRAARTGVSDSARASALALKSLRRGLRAARAS